MTADLDLSPEAVERLASMLDRASGSAVLRSVYLDTRDAEWCAVTAAATLRAQEQVSAEFEGDCWKAMRNLLERTGFDWSEYSEDGVSASEAQRWIVEELDRLEAERDAAWQAGAEAMREAAAYEAWERWNDADAEITPDYIADSIRALPLPGQPKGGAA